ncbi:PREDICTED: leucine-rich repeat extensin-like protein 3 [Ipomoea nil]|uniref:leucine-rich repeat extensin-like protein 3 n=1 Tax=Ipomoea nil TaxID=35883 RepID=UPI00090093EA|nr:PREDICTED: leucine-rich repeat extensin-like protein 3 [Ipomoea nil]XP_019169308.1 PREDICTED: leucine-rich repeat extensin-like protein 3 [Ipomoea nil]
MSSSKHKPNSSSGASSMSISSIQGQLLEVTVVSCQKLKDTEWISRQDPYVCLEYASTKFRTRTCTDGGKSPTFQEKFVFSMIEGLRELNVVVWNSNTITYDDFIGSGKVILHRVLSQGYDDSSWPLQTKTGRNAGEVRLIMHYANANKPATSYAPSAPPYIPPPAPQATLHSAPPPHMASYPMPSPYPTPSPYSTHPYPAPSPYSSYPPQPAAYPPPPQPGAYPPPYTTPSAYPPPSYPPHMYDASYYPPGHYPGTYPPPPHY